mmetsp:Transcript_15735/g.43412  ORF Transcript_15735/g.43412 Transcript_15735/m.43412 type:complete len:297 (-) Transcript_15735:707-1597(-)
MLVAEFNAFQNSRHPKETRSPKGGKCGAPLCQVSMIARIHFFGQKEDWIKKEAPASQKIKKANPPTNRTKSKAQPRTRDFSHASPSNVNESNRRNDLQHVYPKDGTRQWCVSFPHGIPECGRKKEQDCGNEKDKSIDNANVMQIGPPGPPAISLIHCLIMGTGNVMQGCGLLLRGDFSRIFVFFRLVQSFPFGGFDTNHMASDSNIKFSPIIKKLGIHLGRRQGVVLVLFKEVFKDLWGDQSFRLNVLDQRISLCNETSLVFFFFVIFGGDRVLPLTVANIGTTELTAGPICFLVL